MREIISTTKLNVKFGNSEVLKDLNFVVNEGDFIGLAGPNGAGKTTLVKTILGINKNYTGKISLFSTPQKDFKDFYKVGYLSQNTENFNPIIRAQVREIVGLGLLSEKKGLKFFDKNDYKRIDEVLNIFKVHNLAKKNIKELSGGQLQRVLLARSIISNPSLLILDEPSTALDSESRENFYSVLKNLNEERKVSIILVTHDVVQIGLYASKLLYLDKSIVFYGKFENFCESQKMKSMFGEMSQHIICHQHH